MTFKTADLCDEFVGDVRVADPIFNAYGRRPSFTGPIHTIKTFEDNTLVRTALERNGEGKILVVDGAGSRRCALVGDQLATLAIDNNWAGIVVNGCIRDSADINEMDIGLRAIATHPLKSIKNGYGQENVPVAFAGITFRPGHVLYADHDGIVVAPRSLA